jgi:putative membrane protein
MLAGMVVMGLVAPPLLAVSPDETFVMNVAKDGMAEVELGKLASDKASSDEVKKFAQRMVADHSKANDELKGIAQSKNIAWPSELDPKAKATRDRLEKLSGAAFDRAYIQEMVTGHRKAVAAFKTESTSGNDPDVKAWAAKTLPTIDDHLKMAQDIAKNVGAVGTSGTKRSKRQTSK